MTDKQKDFEAALRFRHACKIFDTNKKIPQDTLKWILDMSILSPSSFGMEHWRIDVIQTQSIKDELKPLCWNQNQIDTCSELIVIRAQKDVVKANTSYVKNMFNRRGLSEKQTNAYVEKYNSFIDINNNTDEKIASWSKRQCYILASTLCNSAAVAGVDSCMIEGFEVDRVQNYFNLDTNKEEIALIIALGYRVNPQPQKVRLAYDEVIKFI